MWKKLEQLHLYREPLHQREQGRGVGNAVEGTGCRVPILCSRLNSWALNWGRRKWLSVFFLNKFAHKCRDEQGAVFHYHYDVEYVKAAYSDMIWRCSCAALFVHTKRAGSL